jgi:hypothetical protein
MGAQGQDIEKNITGSMAMLYPLGLYVEEDKKYILRNPVDILADGSIVCQGDVSEGAQVQLMIATKDSCRHAATDAANEIKNALGNKNPKLVLIFESMIRQKLLGRSAFGEIVAVKEVLGHSVPMVGIYSYGEIGPFDSLKNIKNPYIHNDSFLMVALG